ncbi:hypothetical protein T265_14686, partial [Opisthorchis viverrini]
SPGERWFNWLERKFINRKVRGSNPTSVSQLPMSRPGQPGSNPVLVLFSSRVAARQRKGVTAERFPIRRTQMNLSFKNTLKEVFTWNPVCVQVEHKIDGNAGTAPNLMCSKKGETGRTHDGNAGTAPNLMCSKKGETKALRQPMTGFAPLGAHQVGADPEFSLNLMFYLSTNCMKYTTLHASFVLMGDLPGPQLNLSWFNWLERKFINRKVRGSNPTSVSQLPMSRPGQPGSNPVLVLFSSRVAARQRKGVTAERFPIRRTQMNLSFKNTLKEVFTWNPDPSSHRNLLLVHRKIKALRQPMTGFAPLGAHQVGADPEFLLNLMFYLSTNCMKYTTLHASLVLMGDLPGPQLNLSFVNRNWIMRWPGAAHSVSYKHYETEMKLISRRASRETKLVCK